MTIEFLITSLIIVASPGPGVLYTLAAGLARGARASLVAALACTLGIIPHMLAAITGAAALLHASAMAFGLLKYAGVGYLLYMAWKILQTDGTLTIAQEPAARPAWQTVRSGLLVNLLNPKLSIFFFAFLPQFVGATERQPIARMLQLSLVFMAMTLAVFALYGVFAASVRNQIAARPAILAWLRRSFAGAFMLLGLKLAAAQR